MPDPHLRLIRALTERAGDATLVTASTAHWSSATFSGTRHALCFAAPTAAADRIVATLHAGAFAIPGQLVADIAVVERLPMPGGIRLTIEALTLDAPAMTG